MKKILLILLYLSISTLFAEEVQENIKKYRGYLDLKMRDTVLTVGGRVQLDFSTSLPEGKLFINSIPIDSSGENGQFNSSLKDSRLWVKTITPTEIGMIRSVIEADFVGDINGNERNTNNQGFRLRHAYFEVNGFGFGQTNSLFNTFITPDTVGIPVNDALVRQAQVRYTYNTDKYGFDISLEQPESTFLDSNAVMVEPKDDILPDAVARVRYYPLWGEVSFAVMLRYLNQDEATLSDSTIVSTQDNEFAWGINSSLKYKINECNDIRIGVLYGDGVGRYIAYDSFGSGVITDNGDIKTHIAYGANISYLHYWSKKLRSSLALSLAGADNDKLLDGSEANKKATSSHINLIYTPLSNLMYAVEYAKATRELENNENGDIQSAMFRARYDF